MKTRHIYLPHKEDFPDTPALNFKNELQFIVTNKPNDLVMEYIRQTED